MVEKRFALSGASSVSETEEAPERVKRFSTEVLLGSSPTKSQKKSLSDVLK